MRLLDRAGAADHGGEARLLELARTTEAMEGWLRAIDPVAPWCVAAEMPDSAQAVGLTEAARGALGHWLRVERGRIAGYQIIAPTTWNFSPRDLDGVPGPLEQALVGAPVADLLKRWQHAAEVGVVEIDPALSETSSTVDVYGVPWESGANCVVVTGKREGQERTAACVVRGDTRADVNNRVKRLLDVRKCSFARRLERCQGTRHRLQAGLYAARALAASALSQRP